MTQVIWRPAGYDGKPAPPEVVKAHVVAQKLRVARVAMHRSAAIWVGERGKEFLVLQCERSTDKHRVLARCTSSGTAYLLREQLERLMWAARDSADEDMAVAFHRLARSMRVRLPPK